MNMVRQKELDIKICDGLVEGSSLGLWEDDCDIILYDTVIGERNEDCRKLELSCYSIKSRHCQFT